MHVKVVTAGVRRGSTLSGIWKMGKSEGGGGLKNVHASVIVFLALTHY